MDPTVKAAFRLVKIFFVGTYYYFVKGLPNKDNVCMIGHTGYSAKHYENTAEAFIGAGEHGSDGVETDVRSTKDGVLVLSHDNDIKFCDGSTAVISESLYEDLIKKPLMNTTCNETSYLCSFERYLEICKKYDMICFIEFKGSFTDELIKKAFTMVEEKYDLKKCSLQSFNPDNLIRARQLFPDLQIMLTADKGDHSVCFEHGFDIDINVGFVNRRQVREFHAHGLKVGVWTCNLKCAVGYGHWLGADYIESDKY